MGKIYHGGYEQALTELERAHALLAGEHGDLEKAKAALRSAVQLFHDAHRQQYEYRSRVEGGAGTAANVLQGVEVACDISPRHAPMREMSALQTHLG